MKIYDCVKFFSEHLMLDVRFHILNEYVEKFIITESLYSHSGKPKKLNFNILEALKEILGPKASIGAREDSNLLKFKV